MECYAKQPHTIVVEPWDDGEGEYWVARVVEFPHCMIDGQTPQEAVEEIQNVKREWIRSNLERGLSIPEPIAHSYSGQIRLRMPPSLHKALADRAMVEHTSINQYMVAALATSVGMDTGAAKAQESTRKSTAKS